MNARLVEAIDRYAATFDLRDYTDEQRGEARAKLKDAVMEQCKQDTTVEQARRTYNLVKTTNKEPEVSNAFYRWLDLCSSVQEVEEIYEMTKKYPRPWQEATLYRWLAICQTEEEVRHVGTLVDNFTGRCSWGFSGKELKAGVHRRLQEFID